jgi:hypothetical protein
MSKTSQAVAWLLGGPGRTQSQAALLYDITQATVSLGLKTWRKRNPDHPGVDARRNNTGSKT